MHLRVILPVIGDTFRDATLREVTEWAGPGTEVDLVTLRHGPASIESEYDEALAGPGILERVHEADAQGVDAIFISCGADPAVAAAREIASVPVVGGFEPALMTALGLGERVGLLQVLPNVTPMLRSLARRYALAERFGPIRVIDVPVLSLEEHDVVGDALHAQASAALEAREVDVFVLGCTGMIGMAARLQEQIAASGTFVPVVDPTAAAITWLESQVRMGLRPSRTTYPIPPAKLRIG
ncbi:aspartate/glutamate racemase family protein [Nocardioides sp. WS12]|uniref:aspartate/glutamate racemase family protein n=1 Tax=Nocardioides sp. WS12 TaxID=2486272 RepID=UPI0015F9CA33|nr:aspartate/glutamate racemase family protein [Nocardioides sp. WS12]